jgi:ditrans,polycis-polyprenyl diphosphate synthase
LFDTNIEVITIYAFSLENFHRPKQQVDELMVLLKDFISKFVVQSPLVKKYDLQVRVLGRVELLEENLRKAATEVVDATQNNQGKVLNVCLAYTARDEITTAIKDTVAGCPFSDEITTQTLTNNMFIGDPHPGLLIRTSGVRRLSDFMLWQCNQNTELEIVEVNWPEFGVWDMAFILLKWQRRRGKA